MKLILIVSLSIVTVMAQTANDKDVAYWKDQAEKNANKDLDKWQSIVDSGDSAQIHKQLEDLQSQVLSAANNMKLFVPVLGKAVSTIHFLAGGGTLKTVALKGTIGLLYGKRDNKSYYLLDGAANWIGLRVNALKGKNDQLASDLTALKTKIESDRDQLDKDAHNFVTSLNKIHDLLPDADTNKDEIIATADKMYNDFQDSPALLKTNQELIDQTNALVAKNP